MMPVTVAKCVFIVQTKCEKLFMAVEKRIESHYRWCIEKLVAEEVVVQLNVFTSYSYPLKSILYQSVQYTNTHTINTHTHTHWHAHVHNFLICMCVCVLCIHVRMEYLLEINGRARGVQRERRQAQT